MSGFWAMFWLAVVMKVPIAALLLVVWWAIRAQPGQDEGRGDGGGGPRRDHPRRPPPRPPRRGPHGERAPQSPPRVRIARGRRRAPAGHR